MFVERIVFEVVFFGRGNRNEERNLQFLLPKCRIII